MKKNNYKKLKIARKLTIKWIKKHIEENYFLFFLRDLRVLRGKMRIAVGSITEYRRKVKCDIIPDVIFVKDIDFTHEYKQNNS